MQEVLPAARILTDLEADPREWIFVLVVIVSCLLHIALAFMMTVSPGRRRVEAPPDAVAVEFVAPETFEALSGSPPEEPVPVSPTEPPDGMIHPTRLYAANLLADPANRQARDALPTLAADERILQLCNLEAMEQVHQWKEDFAPEFLVAYAMDDVEIEKDAVLADGAAFRSRDHWYKIRFECEVSPDHEKVVAFAFSVGDEIPRSEWESHDLSLDTEPDD